MKRFGVLLVFSYLAFAEGAENATCVESGMMCRNCDDVAVCISPFIGELKQWTVGRCPNGSCRNGQCVPGAKCNYRDFRCSQDGTFPDPYDCSKYHLCSNGSAIPVTKQCPNSGLDNTPTAYNSSLNYCGFPVKGNPDCTQGPVPRCERSLQIEPLPRNPNLYMICTEDNSTVAASLFRCPPSTVFNATSFECL